MLATGLNLLRDGDIGPLEEYPSSSENNGILIDLNNNCGAMGYGIEELEPRNPLA